MCKKRMCYYSTRQGFRWTTLAHRKRIWMMYLKIPIVSLVLMKKLCHVLTKEKHLRQVSTDKNNQHTSHSPTLTCTHQDITSHSLKSSEAQWEATTSMARLTAHKKQKKITKPREQRQILSAHVTHSLTLTWKHQDNTLQASRHIFSKLSNLWQSSYSLIIWQIIGNLASL